MLDDKKRWNTKHKTKDLPSDVSKIVEKYHALSNGKKALDIACGQGRNTKFLASFGYSVDAVDYSDYALCSIEDNKHINKIEADLDNYKITPNAYDLIVNINFLERRLFAQIKDGLKSGGLVIFETLVLSFCEDCKPSNLNYLLRTNELLHSFIGLEVIYYEEKFEINHLGEKVKKASIVARKI